MSQGEKPASGAAEKGITFQLEEDHEDEYHEDQFEIGKRLGRGSFATVYVAKHTFTDRKVVVKKLDRIQKDQVGPHAHGMGCMGPRGCPVAHLSPRGG